jgi:hypothetical protein
MKQLSPKEIDDTTEILNALNTSYEALQKEKDKLQVRVGDLIEDQQNGWAEEKQRVEDASFEDGFENLCFWIHRC